jgi:hypothetical protein
MNDVEMFSELVGMPVWQFVILTLWSLVWKGIALWKAARLGSKVWYVVLLIVSTVGILEILYIFVFGRKKLTSNSEGNNSNGSSVQ